MKTFTKAVCFTLLTGLFSPLQAGLLTVTNNADAGAGSLRDRIAVASPGDTIQLNPSLAGATITLTSGPLVLNKNLSIAGLGSTSSFISANSASRVLQVETGVTVLFRGFTLALGLANGAGDAGRGGGILNRGNLTLTDMKVLGGRATVQGGGIYSSGSLSVSRSVIKNGGAPEGGGIYVAGGTMSLFETKVEDNESLSGAGIWFGGSSGSFTNGQLNRNAADLSGGALYASSPGSLNLSRLTLEANSSGEDGGAIYLASGTMLISRSLFYNNSASGMGGAAYVANGYDIQVENTTFSANSAGETGGALHVQGAYLARANTYTQNQAVLDGGAIFLDNSLALRLIEESIISGNTANSLPDDVAFPSRLFASQYNLYGVNDDLSFVPGTGDLIGQPAMLDVLADNGGESRTHAILCGSAALDAANPVPTVSIDQRGQARGFNGRSDIGAFERNSFCPTGCVIDSVSIGAQGACDPVSNTYSQTITLYVSTPVLAGEVIVNGQNFPVSPSPLTVTLTGLPSNGLPVDLSAFYTNDPFCTYDEAAAWNAAADCYSCPAQTPINLTATFLDATDAMRLQWSPIPGSQACRINGRPLGAPNFAIATRIGPAVSQLVIPAANLVNGTTYEWFVRCACELPPGPSELTNASVLDTFFYDNGAPICDAATIPDMLASTFQPADSSMLLTWDPPAGMINCRVNIRPVGAPVFNIRSVDGMPPSELSIPAEDLTPGTTYEWRLRCSCTVPPEPGNQTDFSALVNFTYPILREGQFPEARDWELFPNPVRDELTFGFLPDVDGEAVIRIWSADGKEVYAKTESVRKDQALRLSIPTGSWAPGAYWITVRNGQGIGFSDHFLKLD